MGFKKPSFANKQVELRFEAGEVSIYATETGLLKIIDLCKSLVEHPKRGHIHLEDYDLLTDASMRGTIAIFQNDSHK